jgi:hypothetical protein
MKTVLQWMRNVLPAAVALFLVSSCVEGYKDESTWTSTVKNQQLENPEITITASGDGSELIVGWDVVRGAGGYEVSVYNVDDPENPVVIGTEKQIVDGFEIRRPATEDTKFMAEVRVLDNKEMNNTGATEPAQKAWDNLLPVYATIPTGTNLTTYFAENPTPSRADVKEAELCYQLEAGGSYTLSGDISFGLTDVTIRGDKIDPASVAVNKASFVSDGGKLRLQFMNINTNAQEVPLLKMSGTLPTEGLNKTGFYVLPGVMLQSSKVTGLEGQLFHDGNKKWALSTLLIKDCIVGWNTSTFRAALIRFQAGTAQNLTVINSTLYNEAPATSDISQRFIQMGSSENAGKVGDPWTGGGTMTITNNTFWQISKNNQLGNSNSAFKQATDKIIVQKNVFVESGGTNTGGNMYRLRFMNNSASFTGGQNSQWWGGEDLYVRAGSNENQYDVNPVLGNPGLTYNKETGVFTMTGAAQIAARIGDPRWLPAE